MNDENYTDNYFHTEVNVEVTHEFADGNTKLRYRAELFFGHGPVGEPKFFDTREDAEAWCKNKMQDISEQC